MLLSAVMFRKTKERELTACIQFPKDYPDSPLLVEIKSKYLTPSLLKSVNQICDQELKKYVGKKQVKSLLSISYFSKIFLIKKYSLHRDIYQAAIKKWNSFKNFFLYINAKI